MLLLVVALLLVLVLLLLLLLAAAVLLLVLLLQKRGRLGDDQHGRNAVAAAGHHRVAIDVGDGNDATCRRREKAAARPARRVSAIALDGHPNARLAPLPAEPVAATARTAPLRRGIMFWT